MSSDPVNDPLSPAQKPAAKSLEGILGVVVTVAGLGLAIGQVLQEQGIGQGTKTGAYIGAGVAICGLVVTTLTRFLLKWRANADTAKAVAQIEAAKASAPKE